MTDKEVEKQIESAMSNTKDLVQTGNGITAEVASILNFYCKTRVEKGMTIKDVADKTGLTNQLITKIEQYKVIPRFDVMLKLLKAVDIEFTTYITTVSVNGPYAINPELCQTSGTPSGLQAWNNLEIKEYSDQ